MPITCPKGWSDGCLSDVIDDIVAGTSANCQDRDFQTWRQECPKAKCGLARRFNPNERKIAAKGEHSRLRTPVRSGTVLFTRKNTPDLVGDSAYIAEDLKDVFLPDLIWQLSVAKDCDPRWLNHWLQGPSFRRQVSSLSSSLAGNIARCFLKRRSEVLVGLAMLRRRDDESLAQLLMRS
jgi:type I restriction enzyme S subunit